MIMFGVGTDNTLTSALNFGSNSIIITGSGTISPDTSGGGRNIQFGTFSNGSVTIQGSDNGGLTFEGFGGTMSYGGPIYAANVTLASGTNIFTGNMAAAGGAIYTRDGNGVIISSGTNTFTGNTAENDGGAIYTVYGGGVTISGGVNTFANNTARDGGAIYTDQAEINIFGGTNIFTGNTGAIYAIGSVILSVTRKSDRLDITGTATLTGGTVRHVKFNGTGEISPVGTWTILTAGSLGGTTFAAVNTEYTFLNAELSYTDGSTDSVELTLTRNDVEIEDAIRHPSHNQRAVAAGIDSLEGTGSPLYNQILALPADTDLGRLYNDLSGEIHATIPGVLQDYERNFGRSLRARLHQNVERVEGYPLWASLEGRSSTTDSTRNTAEADFTTWALSAGAEGRVNENWLVGIGLRFGDSDLDINDRHSEADIYSFGIGTYAGTSIVAGEGKINLTFGGSYGYHDIETERRVYRLGNPQKLEADYNAHSFQIFTEAGYGMAIGEQAVIEPYLGLSWNSIWTESFTESGGTARLQGDSQHTGNLASTLGLRWQLQASEKVALTADVRWQHLFGDEEPEAELSFMGGRNFTIRPGTRDRPGTGHRVAGHV